MIGTMRILRSERASSGILLLHRFCRSIATGAQPRRSARSRRDLQISALLSAQIANAPISTSLQSPRAAVYSVILVPKYPAAG
jgi:hypothetical protein